MVPVYSCECGSLARWFEEVMIDNFIVSSLASFVKEAYRSCATLLTEMMTFSA